MMKQKKKLSGAQYRKLRKAREEQEKRMQNALRENDSSNSDDANNRQIKMEDEDSNTDDMAGSYQMENISLASLIQQEQHDSKANIQLVECQTESQYSTDPGLWEDDLGIHIREYLVKTGPVQIKDIVFPGDESGRRFSSVHYKRVLPNGEEMHRSWLLYSQHKNALFCFCCKLFGKNLDSKLWSKEGFSAWKQIAKAITIHEKSKSHTDTYCKWKELEKFYKDQDSANEIQKKLMDEEKIYCKNIVKRFISIIKFITSCGFSFRGTSDKLFDPDNGCFLGAIELLAEFDPFMSEHVRRVTTNSYLWKINYMSESLLNEIMSVMAIQMKEKIAELIREARYYSIIVANTDNDCYSLIIRCTAKNSENVFSSREYFISFFPIDCNKKVDFIIEELNRMKLSLNDIQSQSYDSNFFRLLKGNLIETGQRKIPILPSVYESLISVVLNNVNHNFYNIDIILKCLVSHSEYFEKNIPSSLLKTNRNKDFLKEITLVQFLRSYYCQISNAFVEIELKNNHMSLRVVAECHNVESHFYNFNNICNVIIWHEILIRIDPISNLLEKSNFEEALAMIDDAVSSLKQFKQHGFRDIVIEAENIARTIGVEPVLEKPNELFNRNKTVNVFRMAIDTVTKCLEERQSQMKEHFGIFGVFYKMVDLKNMEMETLKSHCKNVDKALEEGNMRHVDGSELFNEIKFLNGLLTPDMSIMDIFNYIAHYNMISAVPNVYTLLRILMSYPIAPLNTDKDKLKVQIIDSYFNSPLWEESQNLTDLPLLFIESDLVGTVDVDCFIDSFMTIKSEMFNV